MNWWLNFTIYWLLYFTIFCGCKITDYKRRIVEFHFRKVNGEIRQAFGTLKSELLPKTQGTGRRPADTVQVYYDTEKQEYRSFKRCNLISMV